MSYWTWSGHKGELPTLHVFDYGLFNLWEDNLTVEEHWLDADPPTLRPEVLKDLEEWGGEWLPRSLYIQFANGNDQGATMWKLKYGSMNTKPFERDKVVSQGQGLGKKI